MNDATLHVLDAFLAQKPLPCEPNQLGPPNPRNKSPVNPACTIRKIALNNCSINGREAARLIRALGKHTNAHLHISGNPLEDGIEDLCRAISSTPGPAGLHMDMVEFREESSFVALMKALSVNRNISFLSMAGTAPMPPADAPCGADVCEALEGFFANNSTVRFLDLSGYTGKLDEGQLGKGFARALRGLASNTTLTHLRIRNQNLHDDVGTLGSVIRQNSTLRMVDCQDNSWNLTSIQFLAKSLKLNRSVVEFPFEQREYDRVWRRVAADLRRQSGIGKAAVATQSGQESALRAALDKQVQELKDTVARNRLALELNSPFVIDRDESSHAGAGSKGWPSLELKIPNTNQSSLKLPPHLTAANQQLLQPAASVTPSPARLLDLDLDADLMSTPVDVQQQQQQARKGVMHLHTVPATVRYDAVEVEVEDVPAPYHVSSDEGILETPPGGLSPNEEAGSAGTASPEVPVSPRTPPPQAMMISLSSDKASKDSARTPPPPPHTAGSGLAISGTSPRAVVPGFDSAPYFGAQNFIGSRFKVVGGLEAHLEE
jgi:hypothetical protein